MALLSFQTTAELAQNAVDKITSALDTSASTLEKSFLNVLGSVLAGANTTLYKYAGFSLLQQFAETASFEEITVNGRTFSPLIIIGRLAQVGDPGIGSAAQITLTATGTGGASMPAGTQWLAENGLVYETLNETPVAVGTFSVLVECNEPGTVGDLESGAMDLVSPLQNVAREAVIASLTAPAEDPETEDTYRPRVVEATQARAQGGATADYRIWASTVPGVRRVYPYTGDPGQVDLYIEGGTAPDYIPDASLIAQVKAAVDLDEFNIATRRPMNDAVNYLPITRQVFDVEIVGFSGTVEERAQVENAISDRLRDRRPFLPTVDPLPRKDEVSRDDIGGIAREVCASIGRSFATITVEVFGSGNIERYYLERGELASPGTFTWS